MQSSGDNNSTDRLLGSLDESHFVRLFITLVLVFFCVPIVDEIFVRPFPFLARLLYLVVFGWVLYGAASIAQSKRTLYAVIALSVVALSLNALHIKWEAQGILVGHHLIIITILGFFTVSLVRYLFVCRSVTVYTIYAALCSYLLLALIWALAYGVVDILQPGSFRLPDGFVGDMGRAGLAESFQALYFSLVTITTLGYGDISPISNSARGLATAEAFIGQMFIAITVARLVGIYTARALKKDD